MWPLYLLGFVRFITQLILFYLTWCFCIVFCRLTNSFSIIFYTVNSIRRELSCRKDSLSNTAIFRPSRHSFIRWTLRYLVATSILYFAKMNFKLILRNAYLCQRLWFFIRVNWWLYCCIFVILNLQLDLFSVLFSYVPDNFLNS